MYTIHPSQNYRLFPVFLDITFDPKHDNLTSIIFIEDCTLYKFITYEPQEGNLLHKTETCVMLLADGAVEC